MTAAACQRIDRNSQKGGANHHPAPSKREGKDMSDRVFFMLCITALWLWQGSERVNLLGRRNLDIIFTIISHALYFFLWWSALT